MNPYDTTPGTPGWVPWLIVGGVVAVLIHAAVLVQFLRLAWHGIAAFKQYNAQHPAPSGPPPAGSRFADLGGLTR